MVDTKKVLHYLISHLNDNSEGRKKVMKLMFLVNHFDLNQNKVIKNPLLNENFIIYHYGVFSFDVMNDFLELSNEGKIEGNIPIKSRVEEKFELPLEIKEKVDSIISRFGDQTGKNLELNTLSFLGLDLESKREHFGENVSNLMK